MRELIDSKKKKKKRWYSYWIEGFGEIEELLSSIIVGELDVGCVE